MTDMSTAEAARRLGVSRREVQRLVRAGDLAATRTVGDAYLIDPLAANARARADVERGRPWSPEVAWGALWILSGLETQWLDYFQRRRLDQRLATITVDRLLASTRRRATAARYRGARTAVDGMRRSLVLTGVSAPAAVATELVRDESTADGYTDDAGARELVKRWALTADRTGAIVIRTTSFGEILKTREAMPAAVVAADLAGSLETREREAGRRALEELLA